jgi:hypothetical protein
VPRVPAAPQLARRGAGLLDDVSTLGDLARRALADRKAATNAAERKRAQAYLDRALDALERIVDERAEAIPEPTLAERFPHFERRRRG